MSQSFDAIIIGAGIIGNAIAFELGKNEFYWDISISITKRNSNRSY
jgi:L-2-hydroxyglutarate oxidase LhgO